MHSSSKKKILPSSLLTQLGETLIKYAEGVELKSQTQKARDILVAAARSFGNSAGHLPAVRSMEGKISTHAMQLLQAQQAMAMAYTVTDGTLLPNGVQTYVIQRGDTSTVSQLNAEERIQEDFGLPTHGATNRVRHASIAACTCQFPTCWGLPCRHMLRLYLHLQVTLMPPCAIRPRWYTHDAESICQQKRKLLRTVTAPSEPGNDTSRRQMTRAQRFSYLLSECKAVAESAAITEEAMELLVKHLDLANAEIAKLELPVNTDAAHSFDPTLFPTGIKNPGLPQAIGRPECKRKLNLGASRRSKKGRAQ